jgi:[protein-PII] uridylyltransferase
MAVSSHLSIDNQSHSNYTIIEIEAPDRDGLFYDLVRASHAHNISIDSARIATEMRAAFDTFYILDSNRKKVTDEAVLKALRDRLTSLFPLEESLHNITKFNL